MTHRFKPWLDIGGFIKNYYEVTPIVALASLDVIYMNFMWMNCAMTGDAHFLGKTEIKPWNKYSLLKIPNNRQLYQGENGFHPLPELHQILKELDEKEREYYRNNPRDDHVHMMRG